MRYNDKTKADYINLMSERQMNFINSSLFFVFIRQTVGHRVTQAAAICCFNVVVISESSGCDAVFDVCLLLTSIHAPSLTCHRPSTSELLWIFAEM